MLRRTLLAAGGAALAAPAFAQNAPIKLTIATGVDPSFAPYYVAREGGFFTRNGLDCTVNTGPSGSAMVAFLIGNQINSAYGAEQAGVSAHLVDPNVVAVAEGTALLRWISVLGRNIENMEGLKGKKVGVARGTGSETFWLQAEPEPGRLHHRECRGAGDGGRAGARQYRRLRGVGAVADARHARHPQHQDPGFQRADPDRPQLRLHEQGLGAVQHGGDDAPDAVLDPGAGIHRQQSE
jgi:hypothetical protein